MEQIEFLSAVLIVSENPARLAEFYREVVGVPLKDEAHGTSRAHYGCNLGDLHFAIHPLESFPDRRHGRGRGKAGAQCLRLECAGQKARKQRRETAVPAARHGIFHKYGDH